MPRPMNVSAASASSRPTVGANADHPQRQLLEVEQQAVHDDALERRHAEAGDRADESGDDHDLRRLLDDLAHAVPGVAHRGCHPAAHA